MGRLCTYVCDLALPEIRLVKEPFGPTEVGQSITLYCIATGTHLQSVMWRKESDGTLEFGDYSRIGVHAECNIICNVVISI